MKKVIFLFIFIIFYNCNNKKSEDSYTISVTITGLKDSTKLGLLDFSKYLPLDSTYSFKGSFTFLRKKEEPFEATILVFSEDEERTKSFSFWTNNSNIHINANIDSIYSSQGGVLKKENLQNSEINSLYIDKRMQFLDNWNKKRKALKLVKTKEQKDSVNKFYNKIRDKNNLNFIYKNSNSYLALNEINSYRNLISLDSLSLFYNKIPQHLKNTQKGVFLRTFLENKKIKIGNHFIDFTARDLDNNNVKLSDFKGKIIILDFWDRYCPPCRKMNREELPLIHNNYKDKVTIVSFSLDKAIQNWEIASKEDKISWINISDLKGFDSEIAAQYNLVARPTTFIIDNRGIVQKSFLGYDNGELENEIKKLIN